MAARKIAEYHATTLGAVLSALLVPVLSESLPERLVKGSAFEIEPVELPMRARMKRYVDSIGKEKGDDAYRSAYTNRGRSMGNTFKNT